MDAKRALEAADGEFEVARQWLREKGVVKAAERPIGPTPREPSPCSWTAASAGIVQLKCETDFVASSERFKNLVSADMCALVTAKGPEATAGRAKEIEDLQLLLKEHRAGRRRAHRGRGGQHPRLLPAHPGGAGRERVLVETGRWHRSWPTTSPVHVAFARPRYLRREDVPADVVEKERATLEAITRNEGKPEQAIGKIVEGRLNGYFKEICLLEQPYAKDDKQSIGQLLGDASLVRYAQVEIG